MTRWRLSTRPTKASSGEKPAPLCRKRSGEPSPLSWSSSSTSPSFSICRFTGAPPFLVLTTISSGGVRGKAGWCDTRDFCHEFMEDRIGEIVIAVDADDEGAGPTDNAVAVIGIETGLDPGDGQAVDDDALLDRLIARGLGEAPGIVRAIARNVDDAPRRVEGTRGQHRGAGIDRAAQRRAAAIEVAPAGVDRVRECLRRSGVRNARPIDHLDMEAGSGPLHHRHGDSVVGAGADRLDHLAAAKG